MSQLRIYVECHPNHEIRDFHLSQLTVSKSFSWHDSESLPKKIKAFERKLQSLPQLADDTFMGRVGQKEIRVKLNPAFTWEELIEAVVDAIKAYFKTDDVLVTVMERNPEWDLPRSERSELDW